MSDAPERLPLPPKRLLQQKVQWPLSRPLTVNAACWASPRATNTARLLIAEHREVRIHHRAVMTIIVVGGAQLEQLVSY